MPSRKPAKPSDKEFISNTDLWPNLLLALKRSWDGPPPHIAVTPGPREDGSITILLTNLYKFDRNAEQRTYESVDALLADGWKVD